MVAVPLNPKAGDASDAPTVRRGGTPPAPPVVPRKRHPIRNTLLMLLALLVAVIIILLLLFDWQMLRKPLGQLATLELGRKVRIHGPLEVHLWSWTPSISLNRLTIANPDWMAAKDKTGAAGDPGLMTDINKLTVSLAVKPLLHGHVVLPELVLDKPNFNLARDADGKANWDFSDGKDTSSAPLKLPAIQHFEIDGGQLAIDDKQSKTTFEGSLNAREDVSASTVVSNLPFRIEGDGKLNERPFTMRLAGGALLHLDPDKPYLYTLAVSSGDTRLAARGQLAKPFDFSSVDADLHLSGPDLNALYAVTRLALPNTPPYSVTGKLARRDNVYTFSDFAGKIGGSDIEGTLKATTGGARPLLSGDVHSKMLDFEDLGSLVGAPPKGSHPVDAARAGTGPRYLLPTATLQTDRVRSMDADVMYKAESVKAPNMLPLTQVVIGTHLKAGVLKLDPLEFGLPQGQVAGNVQLDARPATPIVDLDMKLKGATIQEFLPPSQKQGGALPVEGNLVARVKLHGVGNSAHAAASNANGTVTVVIPAGTVRQAFAELAGVNVVRGLGLLINDPTKTTAISCGVADFQVTNGVMKSNALVVDTPPTVIGGGGSINLADETLSLSAQGHAKQATLLHIIAPVTISGRLVAPKVGINPVPVAVQTGAAVALGALLTPAAAILPFVDLGLAKNANCAALLHAGEQKQSVAHPNNVAVPTGAAAGVPSPTMTPPPTVTKDGDTANKGSLMMLPIKAGK